MHARTAGARRAGAHTLSAPGNRDAHTHAQVPDDVIFMIASAHVIVGCFLFVALLWFLLMPQSVSGICAVVPSRCFEQRPCVYAVDLLCSDAHVPCKRARWSCMYGYVYAIAPVRERMCADGVDGVCMCV